MNIAAIPSDILIIILEFFSLQDLVSLSRTCRFMHTLVDTFGWSIYERSHPRPSYSLAQARACWSPKSRVFYDDISDRAWARTDFIARPIARPWTGKLQPILAISTSRLIVAAGSTIYSYKFGVSSAGESPSVEPEGTFPLIEQNQRPRNITGMTFVADGGLDRTVYIGFQDGGVERLNLVEETQGDQSSLNLRREVINPPNSGDFVESLVSESNLLLSLRSEGLVTLNDQCETSLRPVSSIHLGTRSWTSYLCMDSSGPYAAFGTSSKSPLNVHAISSDQMSSRPSAVLHTKSVGNFLDQHSSSAVYGLAKAPISSPWGSSPQILISGWYDGQVRCYDLRSSSRFTITPGTDEGDSPASLKPVLSLVNPWSYEPIYSVSCGGGSDSHVAAGSARHSVVSFWDLRSPKAGWSVHAPGNDQSPVYSVILESSRFFGATQSRPFIYDFGPGVSLNTYPPIPPNRDGLEQKKWTDKLNYYVTKYPHSRGMPGNEH